MRHPLPVLDRFDRLDHIEIPIPCEVPWDAMAGDARVRHCGQCRQNVYNIASMTRPEALRLLEASGDRVCVRIFRRADGTVLTADCRQRLREARQRGAMVFLGVLLLVVWAHLCAQFLGLLGRQLVARAGEPARAAIPTAAPIATGTPVTVPVPLAEPLVGEIPLPSRPKPAVHQAGRPKRDVRELAGRIRIR